MSNEENTGTNKAAEWNQRLDEVREFANKNSRWPSTTAKDADEKTLAQWWSRYKYYYKKYRETGQAAGMTRARADAIEKLIDSHKSFERDGVWDSRYKKVAQRISDAGKLWSYKTTNPDEEKVLRWWNQEKTFYRKFRKGDRVGGMTAERADLVENLLKRLNQPIMADTSSNTPQSVNMQVDTSAAPDASAAQTNTSGDAS